MAVVRNTKRTFKSGGGDINSVINDYKLFVEKIREHSEEKVEEAVSTIANVANAKYGSDTPEGLEHEINVPANPIYYKMYGGKSLITGAAIAKQIPELIYMEFGTRASANDTLTIRSDFDSGIETQAIAAPYKSSNPNFRFKVQYRGRYYFLSTIDLEGHRFLKNFWK
jgi:hypothetical protein